VVNESAKNSSSGYPLERQLEAQDVALLHLAEEHPR